MGDRVVVGVPRLAAQVDGRAPGIGRSVDHHVRPARFIGDEDLVLPRRERDTVGELDAAHPGHDRECPVVDHGDFVPSRCGHIDRVVRRHRPNARGPVHLLHVTHHPGRIEVEYHEMPGAHVADVEAPSRRVDTLVIEA